MTTFDEMVTAVRERTGTTELDKQFPTEVLGRFVQQSIQEASRGDRPWLRKTVTVALSPGVSSYNAAVPANFDRTVDAAVAVGGVKRGVSEVRSGALDGMPASSGVVEAFAVAGTAIKVWPTPSGSAVLTVDVIVRELEISGTASPLLPSQFHTIVIEKACALVYRAKGNVSEAEVHEKAAAAGMAEIIDYSSLDSTRSVPAGGSGVVNLARLVELVYDEVGERPDSAKVPVSVVRRTVSREALAVKVHPKAPWLHGENQVTTTPGTHTYALLPASARSPLSIAVAGSHELDQLTVNAMADRSPDVKGEPILWAFDGDAVRLWPTPDRDYEIKATYAAAEPEMVTDADEPLLPAEHRMAIVYRAAAVILRRLGRPGEATAMDALFESARRDIERSIARANGTPKLQARAY